MIRVIINADDLGLSRASNAGILEGARGALTSASLIMNGGAVDEALGHVIPRSPQLGIGVHLNLVEGRSTRRTRPRTSRLYGADGELRLRFTDLLARQRDAALLSAVEGELRDQIERALARLDQVHHLDSHQHAHMVPAVFAIACRLALEYGIPYVRLSREQPYTVTGAGVQRTTWYALNIVKRAVLNRLAATNALTARRLGVRTNDLLVGITFTGHMSVDSLIAGVSAAEEAGVGLVEVLLHPCRPGGEDEEERYISCVTRDYVRHPARAREAELLTGDTLPAAFAAKGWLPSCYGCETNASSHPSSHVSARTRGGVLASTEVPSTLEGIA